MANEFDEWLAGIGINVQATLAVIPGGAAVMSAVAGAAQDMKAGARGNGASAAPAAPASAAVSPHELPGDEQAILAVFGATALRDYQQKKKDSAAHAGLPMDEQAFESVFGHEALGAFQQAKKQALDRKQELAQAHETFVKTAKIPETKETFAPIEIKLGISMTRAERYDAMVKSMHKQQSNDDSDGIGDQDDSGPEDHDSTEDGGDEPDIPRKSPVLKGDIDDDNRDPDYLTKEEFQEEFQSRETAEWNKCDDDNIRPGTIDKCQQAVDEKYGGEAFKEWQAQQDAQKAAAYRNYQEKVDAVASSGPIGLAGRGIGRAIGGEKGEEFGAAIGGLFDTVGGAYAAARGGGEESGGGGEEPETAPHSAPPPENNPAETMPDRPGPKPMTDVDVVKANVNSPGSVKQQAPDAHQADWQAQGGAGEAPPAYRGADGSVRISTDHPLTKNTGVIPPVRSGGNQPPAGSSTGGGGAAAGGPDPGAGKPAADPWANTAPPPAAPAKPPVDPLAKTGPPPQEKVSPGAGTKPAAAESQIPQAPKPPAAKPEKVIPPPQAVSEEMVEKIRNQPQPPPQPGKPRGQGSSVGYTEDHEAHELAWKRVGGHGDSPPAFIYDNQVYLDKSRWPPPK